ncbi:WxcM-like domain-containing protein [Patescibacteria group bacterium AH-259-L05]|nr:WxcM-like domain-containing protein [Patescibacteria group bacterium AH-259-L05]
MEKPSKDPAAVDDVKVIKARGPWKTKSNGELMVLYALAYVDIDAYFEYDDKELARIPGDIRGLRSYTVRNLSEGELGGNEFHRIRKEMVFVLEGSVRWGCVDLFGGGAEFIITPENGVFVPSFILHTYEVLEEGSGLLVIANTLFDSEDPRTHDTYSLEKFHELQKQYMSKKGS